MIITKSVDNNILTLALNGRLDTSTAPELEVALKEIPADVTGVVFDFSNLVYMSSAGLRVLLMTRKQWKAPEAMVLTNVSEVIMEILEITGFVDILTIE